MRPFLLSTLTAALVAGCGAAPTATQAVAKPPVAKAASTATIADARWGINDGILLNDEEQRIFDLLPRHMKPTPKSPTRPYQNWVSNFSIRRGTNARFVSFSGIRLITTSEFVHTAPSFEYFFSGVVDTQTMDVTVYRESLLTAGSR